MESDQGLHHELDLCFLLAMLLLQVLCSQKIPVISMIIIYFHFGEN